MKFVYEISHSIEIPPYTNIFTFHTSFFMYRKSNLNWKFTVYAKENQKNNSRLWKVLHTKEFQLQCNDTKVFVTLGRKYHHVFQSISRMESIN